MRVHTYVSIFNAQLFRSLLKSIYSRGESECISITSLHLFQLTTKKIQKKTRKWNLNKHFCINWLLIACQLFFIGTWNRCCAAEKRDKKVCEWRQSKHFQCYSLNYERVSRRICVISQEQIYCAEGSALTLISIKVQWFRKANITWKWKPEIIWGFQRSAKPETPIKVIFFVSRILSNWHQRALAGELNKPN